MSYRQEILETLFQERIWLSTTDISKKTGFSWNTVQSYLEDLEIDEYVLHKKSGKRDMWRFNFPKWKKMREDPSFFS